MRVGVQVTGKKDKLTPAVLSGWHKYIQLECWEEITDKHTAFVLWDTWSYSGQDIRNYGGRIYLVTVKE
jgi:hypothetical protein